MINLPDINSSLIKSIEYNPEDEEITFFFVDTYFIDRETYVDFSYHFFEEMLDNKSFGKFYLHFIKHNFKIKNMAKVQTKAPVQQAPPAKQRPKTKNESSTSKRFIQIRLDVTKFEKDLFFEGEKGTYADITLMLMPDGTIDKYGSLGMVVQKVPKEVWEQNKKRQGNILGNGYEYEWNASANESMPGQGEFHQASQEAIDDLPF